MLAYTLCPNKDRILLQAPLMQSGNRLLYEINTFYKALYTLKMVATDFLYKAISLHECNTLFTPHLF